MPTIPAIPLPPGYPPLDGSQPCAQSDPEVFFPEKGGSTREAKRLCDSCPFELDCLVYAVCAGEFGIWGGTSEPERRAMAHGMGRSHNPTRTSPYSGPLSGDRPEMFRADDAIERQLAAGGG